MRKLGFAAGIVAVSAAAATLFVAIGAGSTPPDDLEAAKAASARYHSVEQALKDGYSGVGEPCVASPDGAMGIHYVNAALIADDAIDPLRPEILLYLPNAHGKLELIGIEYFKVDADQDLGTADDRPSVLGHELEGPMPGHNPAMPAHYDLHVWFWKANPAGMFAPFNPDLACP
jgi:hypothetical protein